MLAQTLTLGNAAIPNPRQIRFNRILCAIFLRKAFGAIQMLVNVRCHANGLPIFLLLLV